MMTIYLKSALLCIVVLVFAVYRTDLVAQQTNLRVERLTVSDGLAGNAVNFVLQDYLGYLWIGAIGGLHKYDGYTFIIYKHDPGDSTSIGNNSIYSLYEDRRRQLWIGTGTGLSRYLRGADRFKNYALPSNTKRDWSPRVRKIFEDDAGSVHGRFSNRHVFRVDPDADTLITDNVFKQLMAPITDHIMQHEGDGVYKTRVTFLAWAYDELLEYKYVIQRANGTVHWEFNPEPGGGHAYGNRSLKLKGGSILVSTVNFHNPNDPPSPAAVISHTPREGQQLETVLDLSVNTTNIHPPLGADDIVQVRGMIFPLSWQGNTFYKIRGRKIPFMETNEGDIWVSAIVDGYRWFRNYGAANFIKRIYRSNGTVERHFITTALTNQLFIDHNGLGWFGTPGKGLYTIDRNSYSFPCYHYADATQDGDLRAIFEDSYGNIWLGGKVVGGVLRLNRTTGERKLFKGGYRARNQDSLSIQFILKFYEDRKGFIWITTEGGGLNCFNPVTENFTVYPHDGSHFMGGISGDNSGNLWIGACEEDGVQMHLLRFDTNEKTYQSFMEFDENKNWYYNGFIREIIEDEKGFLWIAAGIAGLLRFDRSTGLLRGYKKKPNDTKVVRSVLIDRKGRLWYGTFADGLFQFDRESETEIQISVADGLLHESVMGLEADNQGNLWISSQRGLSRYNPEEKTFRHYFKSDGLQDNEFHLGAHYKSRSGELFFGGANGFNAFYPDSIRERNYIPPIVLTDFKIHNKDAPIGPDGPLQQHISVCEEMTLAYHQNDFSITFAALDFRSPERNLYSFMLENYDADWRPAGKERTAYYTNLDPGEYRFRVKASGADGSWNETGAAVRIIITPPWWKTAWAYLIYGILFAGLLYGLRRYDMNRQQLRHQVELEQVESNKLKEIDLLKSRFFANISHEFRTPLTLMIGPVEQMLSGNFKGNVKEQYRMILRNGQRLLRLINQLLDISRLEAGRMKLQASEGDIFDFLKKMVSAFESLAARKEIALCFQAPEGPLPVFFDRDKLEKIVTNLLGNAFKFTREGGCVDVVVDIPLNPPSKGETRPIPPFEGGPGGMLEITVKDTGIGIPPERLPHIFDRFYQADDSYTRDQEGSGIGLALTKELVELHHGEISVESAPGEGTTFTVRLPLGKGHLATEEIVETDTGYSKSEEREAKSVEMLNFEGEQVGIDRSPDHPIAKSPNILIVEDNADMRAYLRESLEDCYKVLEAEDGEQGLKKGVKAMPDLIISDVMMPNMDGYELCRKLKSDERTSHIPVILLTARADAESKIEGLETGADDYLAKPFETRELRVRVKNLIELRRKLWEKFRQGSTVELRELALTSIDAQFLERAMAVVEAHIAEPEFETETFGREIGLSRGHLNRKLRGLTGQSSHEFIRTLRLKRAAQLLQHHTGNVSEIAYEVGFNNLSHFARVFREMYGLAPSEYAARFSEKRS